MNHLPSFPGTPALDDARVARMLEENLKTYREIQTTPRNIEMLEVFAVGACTGDPFATGLVRGFALLKRTLPVETLSKDMITIELGSSHETLRRMLGPELVDDTSLKRAKFALCYATDKVADLQIAPAPTVDAPATSPPQG